MMRSLHMRSEAAMRVWQMLLRLSGAVNADFVPDADNAPGENPPMEGQDRTARLACILCANSIVFGLKKVASMSFCLPTQA